MSELAATKLANELIRKTERTDLSVDALVQSFLDNLFFVQGRSPERATRNDLYMALAHSVRDRLVERWISTVQNYLAQDVRIVCHLSAEHLTGPHLANNLINLGIFAMSVGRLRPSILAAPFEPPTTHSVSLRAFRMYSYSVWASVLGSVWTDCSDPSGDGLWLSR